MDRRFGISHSRSISNVSLGPPREYPTRPDSYELLDECGRGVSATVWRAHCKTYDDVVAVKLMDLENVNSSLDEIIREAQTMRQQHHPNVLPLLCSFVFQAHLWMVMPYVAGGSILNIMKYDHPDGLEEPVIATVLREVLKGLEYLHKQGSIHRDVKAGNILLDSQGQVMLADFGVAAQMERGGSWGNQQMARNTFVGTPCWMAPEVMEHTQGYNSLADIWSFGITILELAHGHAPFARYPPMKVLLMTIQNPPPTLEAERGNKHFSKAMRDIVAKCLVKDLSKRPTAAQLLEHKFFKTAHDSNYLVKHLLAGMPAVPERVKQMRQGRGPNAQTGQTDQARDIQSQEAYVKGVSAWNFDVATLKAEAERETDPDLAPIPEGQVPGEAAAERQDPPSAASSSRSLLARASAPVQGMKDKLLGTGSSFKGSSGSSGPAKRQGRFDVYEGDAPNLSPPVNGLQHMDREGSAHARDLSVGGESELSSKTSAEGLLSTGAGGITEPEKAKRRGRFHVVEDAEGSKAASSGAASASARPSVSRNSSAANMEQRVLASTGGGASTSGTGSGGGISHSTSTSNLAASILPALKDALESCASTHELMKEVVAAVQDAERGKHASLTGLLAELQAKHTARAETEALTHQIALLKEDNNRLREKNRIMEDEVRRATNYSDPGE
ncbi:hypothetical protein WJX73_007033 [Symbiochloris irregularis]|uniref:Protein kinase domain-containing protein n=1 Tax=Symbiochloris irregularis TaxID=706552 RepID=A0AAW1P849_9CHLO